MNYNTTTKPQPSKDWWVRIFTGIIAVIEIVKQVLENL